MHLIIRLTSILLIAILFYLALSWHDAKSIVAIANDVIEVTPNSATPLNPAERVIAFSEFENSWSRSGFPCPTLKLYWKVLFKSKVQANGAPVSYHIIQHIIRDFPPNRSAHTIVRDLFAACQIERRYESSILLRYWLSKAYFGKGEFGLEVAAASLFNKRVDALDVDEAAKIAVLLRLPQLRDKPHRWTQRSYYISEQYLARGSDLEF